MHIYAFTKRISLQCYDITVSRRKGEVPGFGNQCDYYFKTFYRLGVTVVGTHDYDYCAKRARNKIRAKENLTSI